MELEKRRLAGRLIAAALDLPVFLVMNDKGDRIGWYEDEYFPVAAHWERVADDAALAPQVLDAIVAIGRAVHAALNDALGPEPGDVAGAREWRHVVWVRKQGIVTGWLAQTGPAELNDLARSWLARRDALPLPAGADGRDVALAWELVQLAPALERLRAAFVIAQHQENAASISCGGKHNGFL